MTAVADFCVSEEKARRLASQWPKRCGCSRVFVSGAHLQVMPWAWAAWENLPLATSPAAPSGCYRDAYATHEMRNCPCGSTLVALTELHDLGAE